MLYGYGEKPQRGSDEWTTGMEKNFRQGVLHGVRGRIKEIRAAKETETEPSRLRGLIAERDELVGERRHLHSTIHVLSHLDPNGSFNKVANEVANEVADKMSSRQPTKTQQ